MSSSFLNNLTKKFLTFPTKTSINEDKQGLKLEKISGKANNAAEFEKKSRMASAFNSTSKSSYLNSITKENFSPKEKIRKLSKL